MGFENARTEAPIGQEPWLKGDTSDLLLESMRDFAGDWSDDLGRMSDAELEVGRRCWRVLREFIEIIAEIREMHGKNAFGLGALADGYAMAKSMIDPAAVFVLARKARRGEPVEERRFAAIAGVCAMARDGLTVPACSARAARVCTNRGTFRSASPPRCPDEFGRKVRWEAEAQEVAGRYEREITELFAKVGVDPERFATSAST